MRRPDEVRDPAAVDPPHETVSERAIEGALALIDRMAQDDLEGPGDDTFACRQLALPPLTSHDPAASLRR